MGRLIQLRVFLQVQFRSPGHWQYGFSKPDVHYFYTANWEGTDTPYVIPMYSEPFTWLFRTLDTYPFTVLSDLIFVDQEGNVKNWIETEEFKICADFFATL